MAIDKNFVIKNGLEVNTNVLVAAADEKQVGIGTTRPYYKLHVGGGEGNRGGIGATDITISGIATVGVANSSAGALRVLGISTFQGDIDLLGSAGVSTVGWDASENRLEFKDNASIGFGTGNDLTLWHDGSISYIKDTVGDLRIAGDKITLELEDGTDVKVIDQFGVNITGVTTTNRLLVSGVSTLTSVGSNLIPDTDGNRNIGAATSEWGDLFVDGTAHIDTLDVDETAYVTTKLSVGTGVTAFANGNLAVAGISTINGGLIVGAGATFTGNILPEADGTRDIGASGLEWKDLYIDGTANIDSLAADTAAIGDLTDNRVVIAGGSGELEDDANFTFDGSKLNVGVGVATIGVNGNAAFAGIVTVGGNLYVTGDIHYDEVTGRNLNISGIATFAEIGSNLIPDADGSRNIGAAGSEWQDLHIDGTANIDSLIADTAQVSDLTNTRVVYAGASGELSDDSTLTFNSTTKVLSVQELVGVHTSAGGGGVGIASTTAHVGYGFTYIQFKGPGVSTVYASSTTGIATIFFQGGGTAGAAGTWSPEGSIGVSTSKSVGVNTTSLSDVDLQGIGNTFQGLYIGNGMVVTDNQLNGNHYIGTAYNGLMAGPVTVNGVLTVDGNWAVV